MDVNPDLLLQAGLALGAAVALSAVFLLVNKRKPAAASAPVAGKANAGGEVDRAEDERRFPAGALSICFGSQTGTAEGLAKALCEEARRRGFRGSVVDLEEFDVDELLAAGRAIFLMATYGEGEPTDNAARFTTWLRNEEGELAADALAGLQFAVFGLGNRQYENFNRMGKTTDANLEALGASRMFRYGEGDDDGTLEEDYDAWREELWPALAELFGSARVDPADAAAAAAAAGDGSVSNGSGDVADAAAMAAAASALAADVPFALRYVSAAEAAKIAPTPASEAAASTRFHWEAREARVVVNRELREPADGGSTRHIEIELAGTGLTYATADNLSILPENDPGTVRRLAEQMGYDLGAVFVVENTAAGAKAVFPTPCTVEQALSRYVDLSAAPRRALLERLVPYVVDAAERQQMAALGSRDGREDLRRLLEEEHVGTGQLLCDRFPSARIPLPTLLHLVPALHPRAYTIASSASLHPTCAHITVAVLQKASSASSGAGAGKGNGKENGRSGGGGSSSSGGIFTGCCTRYLSGLGASPATAANGHKPAALGHSSGFTNGAANGAVNGAGAGSGFICRVFVRASSFRLPASTSAPIILVGPGTGVAPMRALLQERRFQRLAGGGGGSSVLYFGCRRRNHDYLYAEELEAFVADGTLAALRLAFSREESRKVYVQDRLAEHARETWEALSDSGGRGGHIYVCGGTAMGADVHRQLRTIARDCGGLSDDDAGRFLETLHAQGRYVQELWS